MSNKPCAQCPWRLENQGKDHPYDFYTEENLKRLWDQVRNGGKMQSCHLTDPSHPDHLAVGTKPDAKIQECPGSVILIMREFAKMADAEGTIDDDTVLRYIKERSETQGGLTKDGIFYWVVQRLTWGGKPFLGGPVLPEVDDEDPEIGLPEALR